MKIYCVEDDANIRELLIYALQNTGYEAEGFEDGSRFFHALSHTKPSLILLDIMLPGESGLSILKALKSSSATKHIPVILVTAKGAEYDKVMGLDGGADDYITKPFGVMELLSRVKAVLRRAAPDSEEGPLSLGGIVLDPVTHTVTAAGQPVLLTLKEFELLRCLMQNPGVVLTRDRLLAQIWGYDFDGETRTVDVHIRTLRQKLGSLGGEIETVRGVGYRMGGVA